MLILNDKKSENEYYNMKPLRSIHLLKIKPKKDDDFPIDEKYIHNFNNLIPENLFNLESENELTRAMSIVELTKILRCSFSEFQNFFSNESIDLVLSVSTLENPDLFLLTIEFLSFLTFFYDSYSCRILTESFLNQCIAILPYISSNFSFSSWCTLLANLFYDVPCSQLINESSLTDIIQEPPEQFICSEYLRLVTIICSIPDVSSSILSKLIKVLIDCIFGDHLLYLKSIALKNLRILLKTETDKKVLYILAPMVLTFVEILTRCNDIKIILNDLKLIRKLFCTESNLKTNILDLLISNNFYSTLRVILNYDNPEIKIEVLKTINAFIKQDTLFNEEEAQLFIEYDFISEMNDSPFNCKIQIINLEGLLIKFRNFDALSKFIDYGVLELFIDVLDTDDMYAKIICYQFLNDLMNKVSAEKELFLRYKELLAKIGSTSVAQDDILNENENISYLAQFFLNFFKEKNE